MSTNEATIEVGKSYEMKGGRVLKVTAIGQNRVEWYHADHPEPLWRVGSCSIIQFKSHVTREATQ
jgi:hypothetical protein